MNEAVDQSSPPARPTLANYVVVYTGLAACIGLLVRVYGGDVRAEAPAALVPPLFAMLALTGVVWILMALLRNVMVMLGKASMRYYHHYEGELPAEWIERPARTFNNLMQLPLVFYAVCLVAMTLGRVDSIQVDLAWLFVAFRTLHAGIMLAWNFVPYRFASYSAATFALMALTYRVAEQCWP